MRFSTIAALCAAPLALAASLDVGLVERESITITEVIVIWINLGGESTTKTINTQSSVAAGAAAAVTHTVVVGGSAGLVYVPDTIKAAIGDMVVFQFMSANHTVTESAFAKPCEKLAGGMDSGFMANPNNTIVPAPAMAMQVAVSTPLWFYCRQAKHCGKGMVFSINPTANKTQADFKQLAIAQNGAGSTAVIVGGAAASAASTVSVAPAAVTSSSAGNMVSGSGSFVAGGACECSCFCGVGSFPSAGQGLAAFGGLPGAMPMAALET